MPVYELTRCIVCGSANATEIAGAEAVRGEVEHLWEFHGARLRPETPPPRLMDRVAFSEHPPLRVVRCNECGLVYRNPIERPLELAEIYGDEAPDEPVMRALHDTQRRAYRVQANRLLRALGRRGSGLEVGSYVGAFLRAAGEVGLQVEGVDVNRAVNDFTRKLGFTVHDGALEEMPDERTFDSVAIWNCFDQLPEPRAAVFAAARLLRPGGVLAIRVPHGPFYDAEHARAGRGGPRGRLARALLAHNNLLTFPYRYGFTVEAMARLLAEAGFKIEHVYGDTLVPIADEWTRGWAWLEEQVVKKTLTWLARRSLTLAPWIEVYARARPPASAP
jgi:SAM-dependent methyltransferase